MKGACGPIIIEKTKLSLYVHGLGGVVKGAGCPRIIENLKDFFVFAWFGRRGEGRGRSQIH